MTMFERMEASTAETGEPAWIQIGYRLLVILPIDGELIWSLDGEALTREEALMIVQSVT
ncbi:hypothetical protein [Paraburkholderia sp. BCC1884]|uniref:hypothetical protein n=1 Tax=Paraburkholderia sp. BCC1884 TaxID=2562668 RepID=UPI001643501C|nr:hypothetical protein [Paraburkholderia sp. BCC1884]